MTYKDKVQNLVSSFPAKTQLESLTAILYCMKDLGKDWEWIYLAFSMPTCDWEKYGFGLLHSPNFIDKIDTQYKVNHMDAADVEIFFASIDG